MSIVKWHLVLEYRGEVRPGSFMDPFIPLHKHSFRFIFNFDFRFVFHLIPHYRQWHECFISDIEVCILKQIWWLSPKLLAVWMALGEALFLHQSEAWGLEPEG